MVKVLVALLAIPVGLSAALALWLCYQLYWVGRSRRRRQSGFDYVYVDQDGTVRELSNSEQAYLKEEFSPGDGGRPYIKSHYEALDGWSSLSGFILRRQVPTGMPILPVDPNFEIETPNGPNKTDAGNGSHGICRVIDASRSPSPDPRRSPKPKHTTLHARLH